MSAYATLIIKTRLAAVAGVTAIVGASPNDRVYKFWVPEKPTYPAIAMKLQATHRLQGVHNDCGWCEATVQVISLAETADAALALAEQVRLALERYGSAQPAGIPFAGTTLYDIKPGSVAEGYAEEAEAFFVTQDWTVEHLEPTP